MSGRRGAPAAGPGRSGRMNAIVRTLIGAAAGAAAGYGVYRFVGCRTGACPLTGNPWIATVLWGLVGALLAGGR